MKPAMKLYVRDFGAAMSLYVIAILGTTYFVRINGEQMAFWLQALVVLLPVIPILMAVRAVLMYSRTWDEFKKKKYLEATLMTFVVVGTGTFAYGLLEGIGFPPLDAIWILPIMMGVQGFSEYIVYRRYA